MKASHCAEIGKLLSAKANFSAFTCPHRQQIYIDRLRARTAGLVLSVSTSIARRNFLAPQAGASLMECTARIAGKMTTSSNKNEDYVKLENFNAIS